MANECKLCALLGATTLNDSLDENQEKHSELHARQLELIGLNHKKWTIDKLKTFPRNGSITRNGNGEFSKEKTKNSALFRLCRGLVKIHGKRDCGIKCSQCKHSIRRSQRCTALTAYSLINHSCTHLNKDLFACRHCHLKFVSKNGMRIHLQRIHSLNGILANYVDLTKDHQSDIMDMVKLCFGKAPQKQLNVTPFGQQKRNIQGQDPLLKLSYNFISKHQLGDRIQCNICPRSIPNNDRRNAARMLLDHARWHLDKPMFTCRLCQYSISNEGAVTSHLKKIHSVAESKQNFKDRSGEYFEQISSMMEDCFGDTKKERPSVISKEEKRTRAAQSSIRSRCGANLLLAERQLRCSEFAQRFQRCGKLECRICHVHLTVVTARETSCVRGPMRHALSHFDKLLFTCRRCSFTTASKNAIGDHVRSKHGVRETNEFDDRTDDFHADFMDILSKCFDWEPEPERPEGYISSGTIVNIKSNLSITSKMHGKELKAARHIHVSELIKNHAKDGQILCRICSHSTVLSGRSLLVIRHAMTHLDKSYLPYRCRMCPYISIDRSSTRKHLKKVHKDKDADKFEDLSDKYNTEIMEILSKCYDWSVEPGEVS